MDANNWVDQLMPKLPGIVGSALAMPWMQGTWRRKIALVVGGIAASIYVSPVFVSMFGCGGG